MKWTDDQTRAVILNHLAGLTRPESARQMGLTKGQVSNKLYGIMGGKLDGKGNYSRMHPMWESMVVQAVVPVRKPAVALLKNRDGVHVVEREIISGGMHSSGNKVMRISMPVVPGWWP